MLRKGELLVKEYLYDVAVDTGATGTVTLRATDPNGNALPEGFHVTKVSATVETAITPSGGTVTFGPGFDTDGYLADIVAGFNAANSVVRSGEVAGALLWDDTNDHEIDFRVDSQSNRQSVVMAIGTEVLLTGKIRFQVEGFMPKAAIGYANS